MRGDSVHSKVTDPASCSIAAGWTWRQWLHTDLRRTIKIGMLAEANPTMTFTQIVSEEMKHADVDIRNIVGG